MILTPKALFVLIIYMTSVYTAYYVFEEGVFVAGGDTTDILEPGESAKWQQMISMASSGENVSSRFAFMNNTYGTYRGTWNIWWGIPPGLYHAWGEDDNTAGDPKWYFTSNKWMLNSTFYKYLAGNYTTDDVPWHTQAGHALGSVWKSLGYGFGLLTFNVADSGPDFSDSEVTGDGQMVSEGIPNWLSWFLLLMVLGPWIAIIYWLLPYIIDLIKAIGNLIPFT